MDPQEQALHDALKLIAENDGEAFRDNKNAQRAVHDAFKAYQAWQRENERENFAIIKAQLIKELAHRWNNPE